MSDERIYHTIKQSDALDEARCKATYEGLSIARSAGQRQGQPFNDVDKVLLADAYRACGRDRIGTEEDIIQRERAAATKTETELNKFCRESVPDIVHRQRVARKAQPGQPLNADERKMLQGCEVRGGPTEQQFLTTEKAKSHK